MLGWNLELKHRLEIPAFCALFSMLLQGPVFTNLIIYRTCYINLQYNESECVLLGTSNQDNFTEQLEKIVEPDANTINLYLQLPVGVICAFLALILGSWSDRNGRKPILISTIGGQAISYGLTAIFCLLPNLSPWYLFITLIPVMLTGGLAAMLSSFLSYITDISDEQSRGTRLGIFEVIFSSASLVGTFSSSYIFKAIGYAGIFFVATAFLIAGLIFTIFVLEESLPQTRLEISSQQEQPPFMEQLKDMARSAFRRRENYQRCLILLCISILSIFIFALISDSGILYLFLRLKFNWTLKKFTIFSSIRDFLAILGTFIGIYFIHKKMKVNETVLVLMGLISSMSSSLVQGLASADVHIYFAGVLRFLSGCVNPMVRSMISKIAQPDEVGKIFSVAVMSQSVLQLIGGPMYTDIYNKSLSTWPSLYNFITAGIYFWALLLTIIVIILRNKTSEATSVFNILEEEETVQPGSINDGDIMT